MGINQTKLQTAIDAKTDELIAVTTLIAEVIANPKPTYTRSGQNGLQTFDWNSYLAELRNLQREARESLEALAKFQVLTNPYNITSVQVI